MPPRFQTLPPAQTSSAREAMQSFFCELCQKGYSRMNDYQAHLSSYDHTHKERLKNLKAMAKDPDAIARARRQEQKAGGVISMKVDETTSKTGGSGSATGGFKTGGFKKSGFKPAFVPVADNTPTAPAPAATAKEDTPHKDKSGTLPTMDSTTPENKLLESDTEDEGYVVYNPRKPTKPNEVYDDDYLVV
ncbi:hypothetical protein B0H63DRAFT_288680 [Podospora didyma]|uniref:C2H2-type domain-containing protein n=1 Tax=Podospora didyma TaxID=330526 RepID=A0AAE0K8F6_9PEZI|nr:hypothetical protein B0H63DRAFT_288680 [Podospora didyma]